MAKELLYVAGRAKVSGLSNEFSNLVAVHDYIENLLPYITIPVTGLGVMSATSLDLSLDQTFTKEVDHSVSVIDSTTATQDGGALTIITAAGATSGGGGFFNMTSGAGGATGVGGDINITSGDGGATSGDAGGINVTSGEATIGASGDISITSGNTASGRAGDITLETGTHTSTTISPMISLNKAVVKKPLNTSIAAGAAANGATALAIIGGHVSITGTTDTFQLPTAAEITTAIGDTPTGTTFDFVVNTVGMTAANIATVTPGANTTVAKMISAGDIATDQLMTVTNTAGINVGQFRLTYITATTCSLHRIG